MVKVSREYNREFLTRAIWKICSEDNFKKELINRVETRSKFLVNSYINKILKGETKSVDIEVSFTFGMFKIEEDDKIKTLYIFSPDEMKEYYILNALYVYKHIDPYEITYYIRNIKKGEAMIPFLISSEIGNSISPIYISREEVENIARKISKNIIKNLKNKGCNVEMLDEKWLIAKCNNKEMEIFVYPEDRSIIIKCKEILIP